MALVRTLRDQFDWTLFVTVSAIATLGVINLYSATSAMGAQSDLYIQTDLLALPRGRRRRAVRRHRLPPLRAPGVDRLRHRHRHAGAGLPHRKERARLDPLDPHRRLQPPAERADEDLPDSSRSPSTCTTTRRPRGRTLKDLVIPGLILLVPMALIFKQPDLGTGLICAFIFGSVMVLTNLKLRSLAALRDLLRAPLPPDLDLSLSGLPARARHRLRRPPLRRQPGHPRQRLARPPVAGRDRLGRLLG